MLDELQAWYEEYHNACELELFIPGVQTDKPGGYIDITSDRYFARVTVWETGECDLELMDKETGEENSYESCVCRSVLELRVKLNNFAKRVGCAI